jgi:hypothetical protein
MSIGFEIITKLQPVKYIKYNNYELHMHTLIDVLDALNETDGYFNAICIYDGVIEDFLLEVGIINKTSRGGCYLADRDAYEDLFSNII